MTKLTVLLGLFLFFAGCATPPSYSPVEGGEPGLSGGSVVFEGLDGQLYATTETDSILQLTKGEAGRSQTLVSAYGWAGSRVVFATQTVRQDGQVTGAVHSVVPGEQARRILRRPGFSPFFLYPSPDGSRVGYLGSESDSDGLVMGSVAVTGGDDVIHGRGQPFYAAWSPDSLTLLTHVGVPFGPAGSLMQFQSVQALISGGEPASPLSLTPAAFQAPAYSPDGSSIALALRDDDADTISVMDASTGAVRRVAALAGVAAMGWSPDGRHLAFVDGQASGAGGIVGKLWIVNPVNRGLELVSERTAAFFWSPNGSGILYMEPYLVGSAGRQSLLYRIRVYRPIAGESTTIAVMRPAEKFIRTIVPFFDQYSRAYTVWSPDSRLVVLNSAAGDGTPLIHLVDTEKQRSGDQFNVAYSTRIQSSVDTGFIAEQGIVSRVLSFGTVPFFSLDSGGISSSELVRPGIDS